MNKIVAGIISFYISAFLYLNLPFTSSLTIANKSSASALFLNHLVIFLVIFCIALFVVSKHVSAYGNNLKLAIGSIILAGLFVTLFYHIIKIAPIYHIPNFLDPYFASTNVFAAWLVIPLIFLFF
jgi:hypothetical protein